MSYSYGSRGNGVSTLQTELVGLGYDVGNTGVDGIFGKATQSAVKSFQNAMGLNATGIADESTLSMLKTQASASGVPTNVPTASMADVGGSNTLLYLAIAAIAGVGAYWYFKKGKKNAQEN